MAHASSLQEGPMRLEMAAGEDTLPSLLTGCPGRRTIVVRRAG